MIAKHRKLVVVSHTAHHLRGGEICGWGPTINEINYLADHWEQVVHVACLHPGEAPLSSRPYTKANIEFVPIRPTGGRGFAKKAGIVLNMPRVLAAVAEAVDDATHVQLRLPTGMGIYLLPAFSFFFKRSFLFWVKYAGSWDASGSPISSRFQRWWLKRNIAKCAVTINGRWRDQPDHCFSFENPCLLDDEISRGKQFQEMKSFDGPFRLAFVGRLDDAKGVHRIVEAVKTLDPGHIEQIDFVGDGPNLREYEKQCSILTTKVTFHGPLDSSDVHHVLSRAHFLLLPSDTEGFPKVIAESACYGAIPVVSNVGSIGQYVMNEKNGFLWDKTGSDKYSVALERALSSEPLALERKSKNSFKLAEAFTFSHYRKKLEEHILNGSNTTLPLMPTHSISPRERSNQVDEEGMTPTNMPRNNYKRCSEDRPDGKTELELLLLSIAVRQDPEAIERRRCLLRSIVCWDDLIELAKRHGLAPLVYRSLCELEHAVPAEALAKMKSLTQANGFHSLFMTNELIRILDLLESDGIRTLPFKGPVAAQRIYGDISLRQFSDLDILVSKKDVQRTKELLSSIGYLPVNPKNELEVQKFLDSGRPYNYKFVSPNGRVLIELHWKFTSKYNSFHIDYDRIWDNLVPVRLADRTVQCLQLEEMLLVLCQHGSKHFWTRLLWVRDVATLIERYREIDWDRVINLSLNAGAKRMLLLGLQLSRLLFSAQLPDRVVRLIAADRSVQKLALRVIDQYSSSPEEAIQNYEAHLFSCAMRERWRDKARYSAYHLAAAIAKSI